MKRRDFLGALGGATAWPIAVRAQQSDRARRLGVLLGQATSDDEAQALLAVFMAQLRELGWTAGNNLQIDYRWGGGDATQMALLAKELVALQQRRSG